MFSLKKQKGKRKKKGLSALADIKGIVRDKIKGRIWSRQFFAAFEQVLSVRKLEQHLRTKVKSFKWLPLTAKEFLAFLSIIFFVGMVEVPVLIRLRDTGTITTFLGKISLGTQV